MYKQAIYCIKEGMGVGGGGGVGGRRKRKVYTWTKTVSFDKPITTPASVNIFTRLFSRAIYVPGRCVDVAQSSLEVGDVILN